MNRQATSSILLILASCVAVGGQDAPVAPGGNFQVQLPAAIANPKNARELALLRKHYDQTVWKDERLAEQYEKWIVRLWDAFLQNKNKWDVVDKSQLAGDMQCLDRVPGGYCTHECTTDADCCAVPGECDVNDVQVCAPFESSGLMLCFHSCESADLPDGADDTAFCQGINLGFGCRSTGGGSDNRKVCVP